jgi:hypothetical protein
MGGSRISSSAAGLYSLETIMSEEHSSYIIDIKRSTRDGFVACLVITPKHRDGHADVSAKVERNLGHDKCVRIAYELLAACGASESLLEQVHALAPDLKDPITA